MQHLALFVFVGLGLGLGGTEAQAEPKGKITKAEVWPAYAFKDDTYVSHRVCGAPVNVSQWESAPITGDRIFVTATSLCVELTVQEECGCRTYETTYRKARGERRYSYHAVGKSVDVTCPKPLPAEQAATCQRKAELAAMCKQAVRLSTSPSSVSMTCPAGVAVDPKDPIAVCSRCQLVAECSPKDDPAKLAARVKDYCQRQIDDEACARQVRLHFPGLDDDHGASGPSGLFVCSPGVQPPKDGVGTKDLCDKCGPARGWCAVGSDYSKLWNKFCEK